MIVPGGNWVLETGKYYEITIDVYDRDSNKMFPSDIPVSSLGIFQRGYTRNIELVVKKRIWVLFQEWEASHVG